MIAIIYVKDNTQEALEKALRKLRNESRVKEYKKHMYFKSKAEIRREEKQKAIRKYNKKFN